VCCNSQFGQYWLAQETVTRRARRKVVVRRAHSTSIERGLQPPSSNFRDKSRLRLITYKLHRVSSQPSQHVHPKHPPYKEYCDDRSSDVNHPVANCLRFPKIEHPVMVAAPPAAVNNSCATHRSVPFSVCCIFQSRRRERIGDLPSTNPLHGKIDRYLQVRDQPCKDSSLTRYAEFRWGRCAAREARQAVWQRVH
jgi:hypothetical protein